jgi:hypothetical protein
MVVAIPSFIPNERIMIKNILNRNLFIWLVLMLLTTASIISSSRMGNSYFLRILFAITILKVSLLAFEFMELKNAHKAWISVIVAIMVLSFGLIILFES